MVGDGRAVGGGGAGDGEREPGVVGLRVVVHVRAGEAIACERRHVRQRGVDVDPVVALADAHTAGEVVHPERAAEQTRASRRSMTPPRVSSGTRNGRMRTRCGAFSSARWRSYSAS